MHAPRLALLLLSAVAVTLFLAVQVECKSRLRTSKALKAHLRDPVLQKSQLQEVFPTFDKTASVAGHVADHAFNDLGDEMHALELEAKADPEPAVVEPPRPADAADKEETLKPLGVKALQAFTSAQFADIRGVFKKAVAFVRSVQVGDCVMLPVPPTSTLQYGIVQYLSSDGVIKDMWRTQVKPAVTVRVVASCAEASTTPSSTAPLDDPIYNAADVRVSWKSTLVKVKRASSVLAGHLQASAQDLAEAIMGRRNLGSVWLTAGVGVKTGLIPTSTLGALLKTDIPNGATASFGFLLYPFDRIGQIYEIGFDFSTDDQKSVVSAEIVVGLKFSTDSPTTKLMERGCDGLGVAVGISLVEGFTLGASLDASEDQNGVSLTGITFSLAYDATSLIPGYNALDAVISASSPISFSSSRGCAVQLNPGVKEAVSRALGWLRRVTH